MKMGLLNVGLPHAGPAEGPVIQGYSSMVDEAIKDMDGFRITEYMTATQIVNKVILEDVIPDD